MIKSAELRLMHDAMPLKICYFQLKLIVFWPNSPVRGIFMQFSKKIKIMNVDWLGGSRVGGRRVEGVWSTAVARRCPLFGRDWVSSRAGKAKKRTIWLNISWILIVPDSSLIELVRE